MAPTAEDFFRALADLTRLRCLVLLAVEGELCVCELTHALDEVQPKVSRHLASLRETGIVADRREGLWIHYRLHPALSDWAKEALGIVARAHRAAEPYARDHRRLRTMAHRPPVRRCA